jgi:superfamily II DNA or RNA helicase
VSITLRPSDQEPFVNALRGALLGNRRVMGVAPCGFGKTCCFSYIAARASERRKRVNIMVHRKELVDQVSSTLARFNVSHGIIAAGYAADPRQLVQVSSVFTLARRLDRVPRPDLWIADEAHHVVSGNTWGAVIEAWADSAGIGVTATPWRLNGQGFDDIFTDMVLGPSPRELIDAGNLSRYRLWRPTTVNRSQMHHVAGELVASEVDALMEGDEGRKIIGSALEHYERIVQGAPSIAFCTSVRAAHRLAEQFRARGWRAAAVDGKMPDDERRRIIRDARAGSLSMLTSCALVGEGLDIGNLRAGFLLNPTESLAKYVQEVMRPMRAAPGKTEALLFDHVGNVEIHGLPDDDREWSLASRERRQAGAANRALPVRQCPACYATVRAAVLQCGCGHVFEAAERVVDEVAGELHEVDVEQVRAQRSRPVDMDRAQARTLDELIAIGRQSGYKSPERWAGYIYAARLQKQQRRRA